MKLFGKTRREIKLQKVGEKDLAINSHWEIKWQMVFGAIKCIVLQMEKNNPNFKYTVRNSQLSTGVHSQLFISAQQRNLVIMVYGSLNTQSPPAVKRLIEC